MKNLIFLLFLTVSLSLVGQNKENKDSISSPEIVEVVPGTLSDSVSIDYLTVKNPMRAGLYSAILPGLGQLYNGKWWKAPIVWGLLGTGVGFVLYYNDQYKEYRGYYLDKLYGYEIENVTINNLTKEQLATIQDDRKRTRDYAIALTALAYIINIVDASVDAHLYGIGKDPDLSFQPVLLQNLQTTELSMGFGVSYKF